MKILQYLAAAVAAAALQPYTAQAQDKACKAENGVAYNPQKIFDPENVCYPPRPDDCPAPKSVCANHALLKLANYEGEGKTEQDYQDLIYSPHRGLWGQTYGSTDPKFQEPAGQNTNDAFGLIKSFSRLGKNAEGVDYGAFLRGRIVELDITVSGGDVPRGPSDHPQRVLVDHYITTDNTVEGDINTYLSALGDKEIAAANMRLEKRDFSPSPMKLAETQIDQVTKASIIDPARPELDLIAYHDIKTRRGAIQCDTSSLRADTPNYEKYHCKFSYDKSLIAQEQIKAEIRSADEMYEAGGRKNIVIKTTASYPEMLAGFGDYYGKDEALKKMKRYMWQPHPKGAVGKPEAQIGAYVQYIHEWLVSVPRSVEAWEMNIYHARDTTNLPFCVVAYDPPNPQFPLGHVRIRQVDSIHDRDGCVFGPYENMLDYLRRNTGNPKYFGFSKAMLAEGPISGNRANLWLLDTASAAGTSDREYRWQIQGSDPTYNMSDAIRYLSYPYVAYQILNADRLDVVHQVMTKGMYQNWGGKGLLGPGASSAASPSSNALPNVDRIALEQRSKEER